MYNDKMNWYRYRRRTCDDMQVEERRPVLTQKAIPLSDVGQHNFRRRTFRQKLSDKLS